MIRRDTEQSQVIFVYICTSFRQTREIGSALIIKHLQPTHSNADSIQFFRVKSSCITKPALYQLAHSFHSTVLGTYLTISDQMFSTAV